MRKALIGLVLAATVLTPAAALAQRHGRSHQDGESNVEQRAERAQQRSEARQERQQARQQQPQQQAAPQQQYVQRNRGGDGNRNWRGGDGTRGDGVRGSYRGGDGTRGDGARGSYRGGTNQQSVYPQAWQGDPNDPRLQHYRELERRNQQQGSRGDWRRDRRDDRGDWRGDRRGDRRSWSGDWRNDRRYDWRSWRNSNRNIFRGSRYYSPYRNWSYRRFSIGLFLEPLFYSQNYWIGDPWQYRLPPAYPGTQWVRYYNDVLLVDVYSGEVIDVIYDFFW